MSPESEQLIRESWHQIEPELDRFSEVFYGQLFEIDPALRALFVTSAVAAQQQKFADMLNELIAVIDDPRRLVSELAANGRRHREYGVRERDYETVGAAFFAALEQALGPRFTPELRDAWRETYGVIAAVMQRGARRTGSTVKQNQT